MSVAQGCRAMMRWKTPVAAVLLQLLLLNTWQAAEAQPAVCSSVVPVCKPPAHKVGRRLEAADSMAPPPPLLPDDPNGVPQKIYDAEPVPAEDAATQRQIVQKLNKLMPELKATLYENVTAVTPSDLVQMAASPTPDSSKARPSTQAVPKDTTEGTCSSDGTCDNTGSSSSSSRGASAPSTVKRSIPNSAAPGQDIGPYRGPFTQLTPLRLTFLENSKIKVGLDLDRAGTINWISSPQMPGVYRNKNLVNIWDVGRLVQQSFYGCVDASCWFDRPWLWNPVQGGSWENMPGRTLNSTITPGRRIVAHANPRNWGGQGVVPQVLMTTDVSLRDNLIVVNYTMRYTGRDRHPMMTQEVPAVFTVRNLSVLAFYDGTEPFKNKPVRYAFPVGRNMYAKPTERWAALIDPDTGAGLGAFAPHAWMGITGYRTGRDRSDRPYDTSYFAHTIRMALTPGQRPYNFTVYYATGRLDDIRKTFNDLAKDPRIMPPELIRDIAHLMRSTGPELGVGQPELGRGSLSGRVVEDAPEPSPAAPVIPPSLGQPADDTDVQLAVGGADGKEGGSDGAAQQKAPAKSGPRAEVVAGAVAAAAGVAVVALIAGTVTLTRHLQSRAAATAGSGNSDVPAAPAVSSSASAYAVGDEAEAAPGGGPGPTAEGVEGSAASDAGGLRAAPAVRTSDSGN